ncbi:MAG: molybdopterin molybdotransferase MoeA [Chloroflexi bacterium]|nr:molybdopterin molybdotransferase MoeA [Chloroflexota bacterium]
MIEVVQPVASGGNVIQAGEDMRRGDVLVPAGHRLRPADIGLLAGAGMVSAPVRRRARVGIISTGDEIVPHAETPPPGKMRDINGVNIAALSKSCGAEPRFYGIAPDDELALREMLERAISENDLVALSGGSSVGSRDTAARVMNLFGRNDRSGGIIVHGIAMKPGKPVIIAFAGDKPVFGLPGHPAAVSVAFHAVVRPAIERISGLADACVPRILPARLARSLNSAAGRRDFIRVKVERINEPPGFSAIPLLGKSGAISTIARADGYVVITEERQGIAEGEAVNVEIFD